MEYNLQLSGNKILMVADFAEASAATIAHVAKVGSNRFYRSLGQLDGAVVRDGFGKILAHVSSNGRVWGADSEEIEVGVRKPAWETK